ncbi:hypothetical protein NE237_031245 [Protea cynaroides]|uniref:Uncharacterized protein n=1 Tax=Protea cynaroides TaxID=273540 RepID=A0A9Q0L0T2_9MAGN|nr:hypothetical protein NE237_031245 [Protea cynaroides]
MWTCLLKGNFLDVLFYKEHLYGVVRRYTDIEIFVSDVINVENGGGCPPRPKLVELLKQPEGYCYSSSSRPYLVESCGGLLLVAREVEKKGKIQKIIHHSTYIL